MASKDKPYKVYRGGRAKGPIRQPAAKQRSRDGIRDGGDRRGAPPPRRRRKRRVGRIVLVLILGLILLTAVWAALGYLAFRSGVESANARLDTRAARALTPAEGSILSSPTNILLLGADKGPGAGREGPGRADAILLVHIDPDDHRLALLSIPRDLRVEIGGHGTDKINTAYAIGGPTLALRTVQSVTGLPVNHVAVVDFTSFPDVVDALGGVTVDVPRPILSNRFDCPFKTPAECQRWQGWRFARGEQEMSGRRALTYARIRENQLDPRENDITRGGRQQQVVQAIVDETVSLGTFLRLPFIGDDLVKPLATDLSAGELMQLGWVKFRAPSSQTLRCRLGGEISSDGAYIVGTEENRAVIAMVTGDTAPQPPLPGSGPFGPGCRVGSS